MIDPNMEKIRKQYSDQMIFACMYQNMASVTRTLKINRVRFDIEKQELILDYVIPGTIKEITISPNFKLE